MAKYRNQRCRWGDKSFDSRAEMNRYLYLLSLEEAGQISNLRCQPSFELVPAFVTEIGERVRKITYTADFSYDEGGVTVVEDVKSAPTRTQAYQLRVKLLKWAMAQGRVGQFEFREVS